jgi:nucleoside-diphosphate-sugar epimerase
MNILLTGFSGILGTAVAESLFEAGHKLRVVLHGAAIDPQDLNPRLEVVWGGLSQHHLFDQMTKDIDVVIHCAWDGREAFDGTLEKVNLAGTMNLIKSAERNKVRTFIHISSVGVYGLSRSLWGEVLDENQPLIGKEESLHPYPWVKVIIERKCEELRGKLDMNLVILRPGLIFSNTKAPAKKMVTFRNKKYGIFVGNARNHLPYIHVNDVAEMISIIIKKPPRYGVYNCVPTLHLSAAEFFKKWVDYRGLSAEVLRLPPLILRLMAWSAGKLKSLLGRKVSGSKIDYQILTGMCDIRYSADRAVQELGWQDSQTGFIAVKSKQ